MPVNVQREERRLKEMTVAELRLKYAELYGEETLSTSKPFLIKRILWRLQCLEHGDITERARRRALEIANDADLRLRAPAQMPLENKKEPLPKPKIKRDRRLPSIGTIIIRKYKGKLVEVSVDLNGFGYNGKNYSSLSAIAREVTGSHWNGFRFFGLTTTGDDAA